MSNVEHNLPKFPEVSLEREGLLRRRLNEFISQHLFERDHEDFGAIGSAKIILEEAAMFGLHGRVYFLLDQFDIAPPEERGGWTYTVLEEQGDNSPALNQSRIGPEWWTKKQVAELGEDMTDEVLNTSQEVM